jgi:phosphohistidine phosphatase
VTDPVVPDSGGEPDRLDHPVQLLLLRHADAGNPATWAGDDDLRPLSAKGRRQARWVGRWLATQRRPPDVVVASPKVRAIETASLAASGWGGKAVVDDRLAGSFGVHDVESLLRDRGPSARRIMLVGHDPDFSELASELVGASIALRKGAVARIDLAGPVDVGVGTLRWLVPAEALFEE